MGWIDWAVVAVYLLAMLGMAVWLGRRQRDRADYYVGGHRTGAVPIALSTMATQCSTNSLLGAPAFVAFSAGGGLLWLQYELAVPLAMVPVMLFLLPVFRRHGLISVYHYLELRFGVATRLVLSGLFQLMRAFATGVIVYGMGLVLQSVLDLPFWASVLLLGLATVGYDVLGGIRAVIYSDVVQMLVLVVMIWVMFAFALDVVGGWDAMWAAFPQERVRTLDFAANGFSDGVDFAFWPMLIGGFLLYIAYYGCDQSQVQRELSSKDVDGTNMALFLNGVFRFPVVLSYCLLGVAIGAYAAVDPTFVERLPLQTLWRDGAMVQVPNYNLAVPSFILQEFPPGLVGLAFVALFAAAMSSLDSVLNSLSAVTMEDFVRRFWPAHLHPANELRWSRVLTLCWGLVTIAAAFVVGRIADSVLVAINMVSSLINGPILGVFALGLLTRRTTGTGALTGFAAGFLANLLVALAAPAVSWLWWNLIGFAATVGVGLAVGVWTSTGAAAAAVDDRLVWSHTMLGWLGYRRRWSRYQVALVVWTAAMFGLLWMLPQWVAPAALA